MSQILLKTGSQQYRNTVLQHPRHPLARHSCQGQHSSFVDGRGEPQALTPLLTPSQTWQLLPGEAALPSLAVAGAARQGMQPLHTKASKLHQTCSKFQNPCQVHALCPGDKRCNTLHLKLAGHKFITPDSFERSSELCQGDGNAVAWRRLPGSSTGAAEPSILFGRTLELQQGPGQLLMDLNLPREQPTFCLSPVPNSKHTAFKCTPDPINTTRQGLLCKEQEFPPCQPL